MVEASGSSLPSGMMYISRRGFAWSHFAVIEEGGFSVGKAHQHEAASTNVASGGFDDGESKGRGDRSVHGVTAAFQNFDASLRGEWVVGGNHAVRAANGLLRPLLGDVGVIAKFGGGLGRGSKGEKRSDKQGRTVTKKCFFA